MEGKTVVFNGDTYIRHPNSKYYFKYTTKPSERKNAQQLHRAVWAFYNGLIPPHCHIHHIDGDVDNNNISNLECIDASEHLSEHAKKNLQNEEYARRQMENLDKAQHCAVAWHKSPEGREWHKKHAYESVAIATKLRTEKVCEECGATFQGNYNQRFCTKRCSNYHYLKLHRFKGYPKPKACEFCGTEFMARSCKSRFCCNKCKQRFYDKEKKKKLSADSP